MKLYMLDTNILIYAIKHPLSSMVDRIVDLAVQGKLCISAVTYGELEVGILKSAWQEKSRKAVEAILSGIPTLAYDQLAACWYAKLKTKLEREGTPVGDPDLMIGGHAAAAGCILVTNNVKHFERMGIAFEDWLNGLR